MAVTIAGYERFRPIGSGGFSTVYEARQPELNRRVAVKVLTLGADRGFDKAAFEGECRAMGTVSEHPNIVTVFESGYSDEGYPYITMELYNETLLDKIKTRGHLPLESALSVGVLMASALHRAHIDSLLHRDIKPQNIFFSQYDEPVLGDFGIAAIATEQHEQRAFGLTFHYAAPEVIDGDMPQVEADIYSLGATLYTALAGHRPFARPGAKENEAVIANRIMSEPPPPIRSQQIPDNIERSLFSLLAKHPNDRPRTALEVGKLLRGLQSRMGFEMTPMRVAVGDFDEDHTIPRTPAVQNAVSEPETFSDQSGLKTTGDLPSTINEDSLSGSVTRYRPSERSRPTSDYGEQPTTDGRSFVGIGAIVALLLLIVGGYFLFLSPSGDQDLVVEEPTDTTTTTIAIEVSSPPEVVTAVVMAQENDSEAVISWEAAERATEYRIDFVTGDLRSVTVAETDYVMELPESGTVPICVEVVAISEDKRVSAPSPQSCLDS